MEGRAKAQGSLLKTAVYGPSTELCGRANGLGADPHSTRGGREGVSTSESGQATSEVGYPTGNSRPAGI